MYPNRRRFEDGCLSCQLGVYQTLVAYEKESSERHNRFFALIGIIGNGVPGADPAGQLRKHLRSSDYVLLLKEPDRPPQGHWKIGVLLPQTDDWGVAIIKERLIQLYAARRVQIQIGAAVYPDDGTTPEKLMEAAFTPTYASRNFSIVQGPCCPTQHFPQDGLSGDKKNPGRQRTVRNQEEAVMKKWNERIKALLKDEEGASAVEYGVLVAGIIVISILLIYSIGEKVADSFQAVDDNMTTPVGPREPAGG